MVAAAADPIHFTEAGDDDQTRDVHDHSAFDHLLGDGRDLTSPDSDMPDRVEFGLGSDNPPIGKDNVVGCRRGRIHLSAD